MKLDRKKFSLLVSFLFFLGFLVLFYGISVDATWLGELDYFGNQIFRLNVSREFTAAVFAFTHIGSLRNLFYAALLIGAMLLYKKEKFSFFWFGIAGGLIGGAIPLALKNTIRRPRPTDGLMVRVGYSFPSGHAMGAIALYGLVIILAAIYIKIAWLRYTVMISSLAIILIVSWSRIHIGVHYLSDILGSIFLGMSLLIVAWVVISYSRKKRERSFE